MSDSFNSADFQNIGQLLRALDEEVQLLTLVTGTLEDGSAHYAYVSIPPSKYQAFKEAEARGNYDLAEYGTILKHGAGVPSEEVKREMEAQYGADHMLEEELKNLVKRAADAKN